MVVPGTVRAPLLGTAGVHHIGGPVLPHPTCHPSRATSPGCVPGVRGQLSSKGLCLPGALLRGRSCGGGVPRSASLEGPVWGQGRQSSCRRPNPPREPQHPCPAEELGPERASGADSEGPACAGGATGGPGPPSRARAMPHPHSLGRPADKSLLPVISRNETMEHVLPLLRSLGCGATTPCPSPIWEPAPRCLGCSSPDVTAGTGMGPVAKTRAWAKAPLVGAPPEASSGLVTLLCADRAWGGGWGTGLDSKPAALQGAELGPPEMSISESWGTPCWSLPATITLVRILQGIQGALQTWGERGGTTKLPQAPTSPLGQATTCASPKTPG